MLTLSLNSPFNELDGVKAIATGHPVYLVVAEDGSHLVIKREEALNAQANLKANLRVMSVATGKSTGKVLVQSELDTLRDFLLESHDAIAQFGLQEPVDVVRLRADVAKAGTWLKMNEAPGVTDLKAAITALVTNQDKTGVRAIAKGLKSNGGLEMLGKLIAADLYNHNSDRFVADGLGGAQNPRVPTSRFRVIQNIGNILLLVENRKLKPVGLDSFESASIYADLSKTIQAIEADDASMAPAWYGRKLTSGQAAWRTQFAADICADFEDAWGPRNRRIKFASTARLPTGAPARIVKGINVAIISIKAHVQMMANRASSPAGLASRWAIINT